MRIVVIVKECVVRVESEKPIEIPFGGNFSNEL